MVDDEPVNVQVALAQLARAGYEVATALNGHDALRMVSEGLKVDAVLLDVMMPRMDGYEVCARLRERYAVASLPVIMLTAKNQVADLVQGLNAGANDYITKPFTGQELLARLRTHLRLSRVNHAIGQFVPYPFLQILGRDSIVDVRLGDSVARDMSVLFANMRAFTRLTEQMSPEQSFGFINRYFGLLAPAVLTHGGFVDKYIGDAIMALFEGSADDAIESGLAMSRALEPLNADRLGRGLEPIRIGVGINTGRLVLGTVGSENRMDTTVISDAVNIASRLQGLTRRYDTQLLVTEQTMAALRDRKPGRAACSTTSRSPAGPKPSRSTRSTPPSRTRSAPPRTPPGPPSSRPCAPSTPARSRTRPGSSPSARRSTPWTPWSGSTWSAARRSRCSSPAADGGRSHERVSTSEAPSQAGISQCRDSARRAAGRSRRAGDGHLAGERPARTPPRGATAGPRRAHG